jgi:hypothetical protein
MELSFDWGRGFPDKALDIVVTPTSESLLFDLLIDFLFISIIYLFIYLLFEKKVNIIISQ